ncbi:MAG: IreB family regulatory phosphoprotein [Monoglobales bacterium]
MGETIWYNDENERKSRVETVMSQIYDALKEKGYDPVSQIVGYILSGDPTYITSHKGARSLITKVDTDEILEELVKHYLTKF